MPKILHLEDNEDNIYYMLTRRLNKHGFEVVMARDEVR
jgi:hypothetical protein